MASKQPLTIRLLCFFGGSLIILGAWQLAAAMKAVSPILLPTPAEVFRTFGTMLLAESFWHDVRATVLAWFTGVVVGTLFGGIFGLVAGLNKYIWNAAEPWVEFFRALPSVVLVPFLSLFFGIGSTTRIVACALVVFLLMAAAAATAVSSIRSSYLRLTVAWRATPWQTLWHIYVPGTLPHLAVATRAAIPLALIVTIAADMVVATDAGLGRIVMDSLAVLDTRKLYASVFAIGILGYCASLVAAFIERTAIHWKTS